MIANLILAAGASSRMRGADKLLEPVGGLPVLRVLADRALSVGPTFVTLPDADHPRRAVLPKDATVVTAAGLMSDSIRAGIAALPADVRGVMILPADMPDITAKDIAKLHAAAMTQPHPIIRATTQDGRFGHPIYFAASEFAALSRLSGDSGARAMLQNREDDILHLPLDGDRARLDLDTPEDWVAYRAR